MRLLRVAARMLDGTKAFRGLAAHRRRRFLAAFPGGDIDAACLGVIVVPLDDHRHWGRRWCRFGTSADEEKHNE